ncbi:MAG: transposase [Methanobrevibacter sp.]|jgi:transposase-like protein|nr:transposase [Candidatus Methanoflexus mossambicus]
MYVINDFAINEKYAMNLFRQIRWSDGVYCPKCKSFEIIEKETIHERKKYKCKTCNKQFNDLTGTVFQKSHLPIGVIFYLIANFEKKTIQQLYDETKISRKAISRIKNRVYEELK